VVVRSEGHPLHEPLKAWTRAKSAKVAKKEIDFLLANLATVA